MFSNNSTNHLRLRGKRNQEGIYIYIYIVCNNSCLDKDRNETGPPRRSGIGSFCREIQPGETFSVYFARHYDFARFAVEVNKFQ